MRYPLSEKARPDGSHPPDRADAVRRGKRYPLRLSPVRQGCLRAARLQPALHRDDGPLGFGGDRRFRQGARSHPVQQRRHLQQFRASANFDRGYGRQRHRLHRRAGSCEGRRAGFLHRGFRCSGDRRAGAGPRSQTGPRRDRTTRGRGYGGGRALGHVRIESGAAAATRKTIMATLTGKTALVTGASRGIGRASALALAAAGAQVLVHYGHGEKEADGVVAEIRKAGGRPEAIVTDLAAADGAGKLAKQTRSIVGGRLDILVANAGVLKAATIEETTVEDFDRLFAVNVRAPFFLVQQFLPIMCKGSSIVFLSSLAARAVVGTEPAYAATKGAIDTLVRHLASTLGARGIRVNAGAPGVVETDMLNFTKTDLGRDDALGMQALKRLAQPDDISGGIAFLASDNARWITGDITHVDGGSKL